MNVRAFTQEYNCPVTSLPTQVAICKAYNPQIVPPTFHPEFKTFTALWDTGAEASVITKRVAEQLGISPNGSAVSYNAGGSCIVNTYLVNIGLPNNVIFQALRVSEGELTGFDVLIGMDIIGRGDFAISCVNGKTKFTFQLPSTHDIDFVKESNTRTLKKTKEPRPNDPCPCGSGRKYKNCHGKK